MKILYQSLFYITGQYSHKIGLGIPKDPIQTQITETMITTIKTVTTTTVMTTERVTMTTTCRTLTTSGDTRGSSTPCLLPACSLVVSDSGLKTKKKLTLYTCTLLGA